MNPRLRSYQNEDLGLFEVYYHILNFYLFVYYWFWGPHLEMLKLTPGSGLGVNSGVLRKPYSVPGIKSGFVKQVP